MTNPRQNTNLIYNEIKRLFTSEKYKEVINYWEKEKKNYSTKCKSISHENLMIAIAGSYFEVGMLSKSLYYSKIQLEIIKRSDLPAKEKKESYGYCYNAILAIHCLQNELIAQYRVRIKSLQYNTYDKEYMKETETLEKLLYLKYKIFIKYMVYLLFPLVIFSLLLQELNVNIPIAIYMPYSIISIAGIILALTDKYFPATSKKFFLKCLRLGL